MARKQSLLTREKRLGAIGAYQGEINPLTESFDKNDASQWIRTFSQAAPDDIIQTLRLLNGIAGAGIVIHGARGCAATQLSMAPDGAWAVTNLNERDTIMGSDALLRKTILDLHGKHHPWVIFVVATPVVAINNDDIQSVVTELSGELDIPVIPVKSDGFRSRIAATGYDAAYQAILTLIPPGDHSKIDNLINLVVLDSESPAVTKLVTLLADVGLMVNTLPSGAGKDNFEKTNQAALTVVIDPDAGALFALEMEKNHHVPYLKLPVPVGLEATEEWLVAIAEATGHIKAARALHQEQQEELTDSPFGNVFNGKQVYLGFPVSVAIAVASLVRNSGGIVAGISVDHVDVSHVLELKSLQEQQPGVPLHVAGGQPFEAANLLRRIKPDLYIGTPERAVWAARAGIPVVAIEAGDILGYHGLQRLFRQAHHALVNTTFVQRLGRAASLPYKDSWYRRSSNWHIKLEVK
jgi:nitrogenase molybdenum-iron protein alpha/beta subunit